MAIKRKKEAEAAAAKKSVFKEQVTVSTTSQPTLAKAKGKESTKKRDNEYLSFIQELAALEIPIMPKEAVKRVLERFPRSEHTDLPIDKKIYESFSYQKGKRTPAKKVCTNAK